MHKSLALMLVLIIMTSAGIMIAKPVSMAASVENSWVEKAPMPSPDSGYEAATLNGIIYIIGASSNYVPSTDSWNVSSNDYAYNPSTDKWTAIAPMLTPRDSFSLVACGDKIYAIGGAEENKTNGLSTSGCSVNEAYNPSSNTWTTKASMPTSRLEMTANAVNGLIYVVGGMTGQEYSTMNITEIYNPATDSWSKGAPMLYPVTEAASAVVNNKIYVIGGNDEYLFSPSTPNSPAVNFTQIYNLTANIWSLGAPIPTPTWQAGAAATTGELAPTRIYVFGNCIGFGVGSDQSYAYDPSANNWTTASPLPNSCYGPGVTVVNDLLYVIGGGQSMSPLSTNEQYIPIGYNGTGLLNPSQSPISTAANTLSMSSPLAYVFVACASIAIVSAGLIVFFQRRHRISQR